MTPTSPTPASDRPIEWTDPACPVARTVDLVGDRWSLLIVRDATEGARTFTQLQEGLGIARNILSDRLHKLVDRGVLRRVPVGGGRRQAYELTDAGRDLFTVVVALRQWGERHAFGPGEGHSVLVDGAGTPVPALDPRSAAGETLTGANTRVERV